MSWKLVCDSDTAYPVWVMLL